MTPTDPLLAGLDPAAAPDPCAPAHAARRPELRRAMLLLFAAAMLCVLDVTTRSETATTIDGVTTRSGWRFDWLPDLLGLMMAALALDKLRRAEPARASAPAFLLAAAAALLHVPQALLALSIGDPSVARDLYEAVLSWVGHGGTLAALAGLSWLLTDTGRPRAARRIHGACAASAAATLALIGLTGEFVPVPGARELPASLGFAALLGGAMFVLWAWALLAAAAACGRPAVPVPVQPTSLARRGVLLAALGLVIVGGVAALARGPSAEAVRQRAALRCRAADHTEYESAGPGRVRALHARLARDPDDAEARGILAGAYVRSGDEVPDGADHLAWMVRHCPAHSFHDGIIVADAGDARLRALWLAQIARYPDDWRVARNAGRHFLWTDSSLAAALLARAARDAPDDTRIAALLGMAYSSALMDADPREQRALADGALALAERWAGRTPGLVLNMLPALGASAAELLGRAAERERFARAMLDSGDADERDEAHLHLGAVALDRGDLAAAREQLAAVATDDGSRRSSYGPSMVLADRLVRAGASVDVLALLQRCAQRWPEVDYDPWIDALRRGEPVDFGWRAESAADRAARSDRAGHPAAP